MLNEAWLRLLKRHGGRYKVMKVKGGQTGIHRDGAPFMTLTPGMFDYEARIRAMDEADVDVALVTLHTANDFSGSAKICFFASKIINETTASRYQRYPTPLRFMLPPPSQHWKLRLPQPS